MAQPPDEAEVLRAAAGDREALAALWRTHRRWVAAVLLAYKPAAVDLEDLLQDVAAALLEGVGELRDATRLRPWLRTLALHTALSAGREQRRRRRWLAPLGDEEPPARGADDGAAQDEQRRQAGRILDLALALPADYREPLLLRAVEGLGQQAIAEILAVPVTTVETRLARARRMLREAAARHGEAPPCASTPQSLHLVTP